MSPIPVIAIFDVGKTNKKLFLFDENYKIVFEKSARFIETEDEDGYPCENLDSLRLSIFDSLSEIFRLKEFQVRAVNFSTYGASFVYIGEGGQPLTKLYNYLKPYPEELSDKLYAKYGGKDAFSIQTASPTLGSLNSGLQLYRLKKEQPEVFDKVKYALHLPQYVSYLLTGNACSDVTSIGCHTAMWDFDKNRYHEWIQHEGLAIKLPPIIAANKVVPALFPGNSQSSRCCTTRNGDFAKSIFGFNLVECSEGTMRRCFNCSRILVRPAMPAADSRWPMLDFTEPMRH